MIIVKRRAEQTAERCVEQGKKKTVSHRVDQSVRANPSTFGWADSIVCVIK